MVTVEDVVFALPLDHSKVDLAALFSQTGPIELEIGCGKGGFLLKQAKAHPDRNYVGIEWANKYFKYAADRMARWNLANVRIVRTDAKHFVMRRLEPECLDALHVYHPDPWPKKRHHKRRLIDADFAAAAVRALKPNGRWAVQSDHAGYFEVIRSILTSMPELQPVPFDDAEFGTADERTETNYETKYLREGREMYRLAFRKRG